MNDKLQGLLLGYIRENNPDLLYQLDEDDALHAWVTEQIREVELVLGNAKATRIADTAYMDLMTVELKPSKFHYMRDLLEDQFVEDFNRFLASGELRYELIELIGLCNPFFEAMPLQEDIHENRQLDHAVKGVISQYLAGSYE